MFPLIAAAIPAITSMMGGAGGIMGMLGGAGGIMGMLGKLTSFASGMGDMLGNMMGKDKENDEREKTASDAGKKATGGADKFLKDSAGGAAQAAGGFLQGISGSLSVSSGALSIFAGVGG